jgi:hypothetical protein
MNSFKIIVLLILSISLGTLNAQNHSKAFSESSVVWYGVDYSLARFTLVTESAMDIVTKYIPTINAVIVQEYERKYNIRKFFNKYSVAIELDNINVNNQKIEPAKLVVDVPYTINQDDVKKLVSAYNTEGKTGMGLVFIAENMNKTTSKGSFYVCFFDLATKEIIDSKRMEGKAGGAGFRNFWVGAVYDVMKEWAKAK